MIRLGSHMANKIFTDIDFFLLPINVVNKFSKLEANKFSHPLLRTRTKKVTTRMAARLTDIRYRDTC